MNALAVVNVRSSNADTATKRMRMMIRRRRKKRA
jgi:hypothetical protein